MADPRATRRETEETVPEGGGVFRTLIEVSVPGVNRGRFVSTERVEQTERRDGEQVLEIDRTTYTSQTTRGAWAVRERRTVRRDYGDHGVRAVESIYTRDGSGNLVLTDQIVSRRVDRGLEDGNIVLKRSSRKTSAARFAPESRVSFNRFRSSEQTVPMGRGRPRAW